jgi:hypothetical protein
MLKRVAHNYPSASEYNKDYGQQLTTKKFLDYYIFDKGKSAFYCVKFMTFS